MQLRVCARCRKKQRDIDREDSTWETEAIERQERAREEAVRPIIERHGAAGHTCATCRWATADEDDGDSLLCELWEGVSQNCVCEDWEMMPDSGGQDS